MCLPSINLTRPQIHDEVILEGPKANADAAKRLVMSLMANPWRELARHWNAPPPTTTTLAPPAAAAQLTSGSGGGGGGDGDGGCVRHLASGEGWVRPAPALPGGHLAGTWRWDDLPSPQQQQQQQQEVAVVAAVQVGGSGSGDGAQEGAPEGDGGGQQQHRKAQEVMPLLVELATDCNVADTWYEAK